MPAIASIAASAVSIVDLGIGNIRSVQQAVRFLGYIPVVTSDPEQVALNKTLILPGVGSFAAGSSALWGSGLAEAVLTAVKEGATLLGICLGMQLLATEGEEGGRSPGLNLIPGTVRKLPAGVRVPHVGWNQVSPVDGQAASRLLGGTQAGEHFYFVHSYYLALSDHSYAKAETDHGISFPAVVERGLVYGVQFHPEKSYRAGLRLLANFLGAYVNGSTRDGGGAYVAGVQSSEDGPRQASGPRISVAYRKEDGLCS